MKRIVLIHTIAPLIEVFNKLGREMLPDVKLTHVLDEPLLEQARRHGSIDFAGPNGKTRLEEHLAAAAENGADAVLVTCSTISPYLDQFSVQIPVVKIDETMIAQAVDQGSHILALATNPATLEPSRKALEARAARMGKPIQVQAQLVERAFDAVLRGDFATHDRLVMTAICEAPAQADLIVLAKASMARVLDKLPQQDCRVPVLTSPHTALRRVKEILEQSK